MSGYGVLEVGQVWFDEDGDKVTIIALDDPPWPVQFRWEGGTVGRSDVADFLAKCTQPSGEWIKRLAAVTAERDRFKKALERIRDDYGEVWGGSREEEGRTIMVCVCCGEEANEYYNVVHDEDCAVSIAAAALADTPPTPVPSPPPGTCETCGGTRIRPSFLGDAKPRVPR